MGNINSEDTSNPSHVVNEEWNLSEGMVMNKFENIILTQINLKWLICQY